MQYLNKLVAIRNRDKPWLHNEIRKQIRIRKRIHKAAKRVNTPDQWSLYRRQRNMVTNLIRNAKHAYYRLLSEKLISQVIFRPKSGGTNVNPFILGRTMITLSLH